MGKNGDRLRAAKQKTVYTFTAEQLAERDRLMKLETIKLYRKELDKETKERHDELNERIREEWERRAADFGTDDLNETFANALAYMLTVPCRVLIEKYGWAPPETGGRKIKRFAQDMVNEIDNMTHTEKIDIREYARRTYQKYGVKFITQLEE